MSIWVIILEFTPHPSLPRKRESVREGTSAGLLP